MTTEGIIPFTDVERDALCEVANVAMARAAASLRQMVGHQILLTVPTCEIFRLRGPIYPRIGGYVGRSSHMRL
jgi:chemotaxis protein CheY-P-specific phosphatase CheC